MRNVPAALALCLFAALALGCSQAEPTPKDFTLVRQTPAKAEESGNTLEAAEAACRAETRKRGIASVAAIFSRLRPGSADEDYIECMKRRGYQVKS
jgi:hypothetical protein